MKLRKFISLSLVFSSIAMIYSGIMLFVSPKGRVAHWTNWQLFGLSKDEYSALHVNFMIIFTVGILVHIVLNIKPLINYLKIKSKGVATFSYELVASAFLTLVFTVGTLAQIAPFQSFIDFEDSVKNSWEMEKDKAPYGHAELSSLRKISHELGIGENQMYLLLKRAGIKEVNMDEELGTIASKNGISPNKLYSIVTAGKKNSKKQNLGKKTLKEVANELEISPKQLYEKISSLKTQAGN